MAHGPDSVDDGDEIQKLSFWPAFKELWRRGQNHRRPGGLAALGGGFPRGVAPLAETSARRGGFDAVIGNPPWDRIKLQEVEWFATRAPEGIALAADGEQRRKARHSAAAKRVGRAPLAAWSSKRRQGPGRQAMGATGPVPPVTILF